MPDKETMLSPEAPAVRPESANESPEQAGNFEAPKAPEPKAVTSASLPTPASPSPSAPPVKDEATKKVESVLEEGLEETYRALDAPTQKKFRDEGERVVREIAGMLKKAKMKARKILELIRGWLRIIPHINRYFLDQEAKIKTDRIMHLSDDEKNDLL